MRKVCEEGRDSEMHLSRAAGPKEALSVKVKVMKKELQRKDVPVMYSSVSGEVRTCTFPPPCVCNLTPMSSPDKPLTPECSDVIAQEASADLWVLLLLLVLPKCLSALDFLSPPTWLPSCLLEILNPDFCQQVMHEPTVASRGALHHPSLLNVPTTRLI